MQLAEIPSLQSLALTRHLPVRTRYSKLKWSEQLVGKYGHDALPHIQPSLKAPMVTATADENMLIFAYEFNVP